jgi:hypothetical protein
MAIRPRAIQILQRGDIKSEILIGRVHSHHGVSRKQWRPVNPPPTDRS